MALEQAMCGAGNQLWPDIVKPFYCSPLHSWSCVYNYPCSCHWTVQPGRRPVQPFCRYLQCFWLSHCSIHAHFCSLWLCTGHFPAQPFSQRVWSFWQQRQPCSLGPASTLLKLQMALASLSAMQTLAVSALLSAMQTMAAATSLSAWQTLALGASAAAMPLRQTKGQAF